MNALNEISLNRYHLKVSTTTDSENREGRFLETHTVRLRCPLPFDFEVWMRRKVILENFVHCVTVMSASYLKKKKKMEFQGMKRLFQFFQLNIDVGIGANVVTSLLLSHSISSLWHLLWDAIIQHTHTCFLKFFPSHRWKLLLSI